MTTRVLIIEDDPEIAGLVEYHLIDQGFRPELAGDGESGLELALNGDFGLIVLDLMIPGIDGLEVCRRETSTTPTYIFRGRIHEEN